MLGFSTDIWISSDSCEVCCLEKNRELTEIELIAGGEMKILRESRRWLGRSGELGAGTAPHVRALPGGNGREEERVEPDQGGEARSLRRRLPSCQRVTSTRWRNTRTLSSLSRGTASWT